MNRDIDKLIELTKLAAEHSRRKRILVLNPEMEYNNKEDGSENVIYDTSQWKIPEEIHALVKELSQNSQISNEDKILSIYKKICEDYVYDDNLISYIQKIDDDEFSLPDWYGKDVDEQWEKNREQHNRRVCYEVSRYLAKSIEELFKDEEDYNVCILWDKSLTHYFVGLTCNDYSITLDLDDFNNIKDLTRIKTGLTAEGIVILQDFKGKFKNALDKFNKGRGKNAIKKIENEISYNSNIEDEEATAENKPDSIILLENAIEILKRDNIDSQGLFEYLKEIVDITIGPESRKKVWKEIKAEKEEDTRYIRCLILEVDNQQYIIDVDKMLLRPFAKEELLKKEREFIPYKELTAEEIINYRMLKEGRYNGG